jgi:predicted enzyme related to lactoylglutathione lyase
MGNPFAHIELAADDVAAAKKFYKSVFDWKLEDMPMGDSTYTMVNVGKGVGGGMTPKMMGPQQPTAWLPYVEVADVKKTIAKAKAGGATIFVEYQPIPMGAIGVFADPQGAPLGIWEAAKKAPAKRAAAKKPAKKAAKKAAKKKGKR